MNVDKSEALFRKTMELMPGGVSSPVRAFKSVGGQPLFIDRGEGPYLYDVDGNRFIDYVLSWGPLILGHAHPKVVLALEEAIHRGTSYGAPNPYELYLAELIQQIMPNLEMIRFVNSGTEATMSALRLARAFTQRNKIIKFEGCYHGHADLMLVQAGSGLATLGLPDSPGIPTGATQDTLVATFNDLESVQDLFDEYGEQIAAIIVEPVAGNMGVISPKDGFLLGLRSLADKYESLLVFDEVMTGFRVHLGGAQALYGIKPDLTTLGKVIGGGLPVGAYGGRKDIMEMVAPSGPVYQAGTLSGNPLAMSAGFATLQIIQNPEYWSALDLTMNKFVTSIVEIAKKSHIAVRVARVGAMFSLFFTENEITDWDSAKICNAEYFKKYFSSMLRLGVFLPPSQFEANFVSFAHSETIIEQTLEAFDQTFHNLEKGK